MRFCLVLLSGLMLVLTAGCNRPADFQSRMMEVFPPLKLKYAALYQVDGLPVTPEFFQGQWTLVLFGQSDCPVECQQRLALVKNVESVKKLFVVTDLAEPEQLRELKRSYPEVAISMGTTAVSFDRFYAQFNDEFADTEQKQARIYVLNQTAMLSYWLAAEDLSAVDMQQEMNRLRAGPL